MSHSLARPHEGQMPVAGPYHRAMSDSEHKVAPDPTLDATPLIDSDHPSVVAFAHRHAVGSADRERAAALYLAVRDGFRYDPYRIDLSPAGMRASSVLASG